MKIIGIIPARMESTRLPNKAVIDICGTPMIVHTFKRACFSSRLDQVYVATNSSKISELIRQSGGDVIMTSGNPKNGTERVAEATKSLNLDDNDIIVNIQGDEPLVKPDHIDKIIREFVYKNMDTTAFGITKYTKVNNTSDIKAVIDKYNRILYCSRSDIPNQSRSQSFMWKMCFIVPFRKKFLDIYISLDETPLELTEYNEYLRIIEHGYPMYAVEIHNAAISVDTPSDLEEVRKLMISDNLRSLYS